MLFFVWNFFIFMAFRLANSTLTTVVLLQSYYSPMGCSGCGMWEGGMDVECSQFDTNLASISWTNEEDLFEKQYFLYLIPLHCGYKDGIYLSHVSFPSNAISDRSFTASMILLNLYQDKLIKIVICEITN